MLECAVGILVAGIKQGVSLHDILDRAYEVVEDEVTRAKVQARLSQLVKAEIARKEQVTTEDKRKIMAYALVGEATEDAE